MHPVVKHHFLHVADQSLIMAVGAKANRYNVLIAFFVTLGSFTYGFNSSVTAGVIGLPSFFEYIGIDITTSSGNSTLGGASCSTSLSTPY